MVSASFAFARPAICRFSVVFGMVEIMSDNRSVIMVTFEHCENSSNCMRVCAGRL